MAAPEVNKKAKYDETGAAVLAEETRRLEVQLTDEQRIHAGQQLAENLEAIEIQEMALDETKKRFKAKIQEHKLEVAKLTSAVNHGTVREDVLCHWMHAKGDEGKMLVRTDTGEMVEEMPLTEDDKQLGLQHE